MFKRPLREMVYKIVSAVICLSMLMTSGPVLAAPAPSSEQPASMETKLSDSHQGTIQPTILEAPLAQPVPSPQSVAVRSTPQPSSAVYPSLQSSQTSNNPYPTFVTALTLPAVPNSSYPPSPPAQFIGEIKLASFNSHLTPAFAADIPLFTGWNLISIPEEPPDTDPAIVLASIEGSFNHVYAYDGCDAVDPWKLYDPADPAASDLVEIDHKIGLWVEITTEGNLEVDGTPPDSTDIQLCEGWNLIGFPLNQELPIRGALSSIDGKYRRVFAYDPLDMVDPWEVYDVVAPDWASDLQTMEPGRGYWILAIEDVTLTIGEPEPAPLVEILEPEEGEEITSPTDVLGIIDSATFAEWTMEYRLKSETLWTTFATGDTSSTDTATGSFDPTLLLNGMYEIRLTATDLYGQSASASVNVVVTGQMKVGHFSISFIDLDIPVVGIPIQVIRTYDSRYKRIGDFGYGWTLEIFSVRLEENELLGLNWELTEKPGIIPSYCLIPTQPHIVTVTMPDDSVARFEPVLTPTCQSVAPPTYVTIGFKPLPGTYGALDALDGIEAAVSSSTPGPVELFDYSSGGHFDPDKYQFTLKDGRRLVINQGEGLESIADLNGNEVTIAPDGLYHSSDKSVSFERDTQNRIISIIDPSSYATSYDYDSSGDLVSFTDQEEYTTTFTYLTSIPHHLDGIQDPRGIQPIRNEYDDDGRLLRHIDANGNTIEYTHNLDTRQEIITQRNGDLLVLEYDDRGNIVRETFPDGTVVLRTFDEWNNLTSKTEPHDPSDPNPITTHYTYDENGNKTSTTDPLGDVISYTYNERGQVLTTTDPLGNTTTQEYDANGNLISKTDPLGNVKSFSYDSHGNVITETDPLGNVTQFEYDTDGNMTTETDPLGNETSYTYDANGNKTSQTLQRSTPSGPETLTTTYAYDGRGLLTLTTYNDGSSFQTKYNSMGEKQETTDQLGRVTSYDYNDAGLLEKTSYADGTTENITYDAKGRRATSTDRGGLITAFEYNPQDQPTKITFTDGSFNTNTFDSAGRLVARTDALGNTFAYEYDAEGHQTKIIDPLGNEVRYTYDANGNQVSMTDPNGETTRFEYDELNRQVKTIYPDGTTITTTYDSLGRRTSETDQAGQITQFEYDALGRLTKVIDALGGETTYTYDEVGNRISQTDANGNTTSFEYDSFGREIKRILPDGQFETRTYDAVGNLLGRTDFMGRTTTYAYKANNQLTNITYADRSTVSFTYNPAGKRSTVTDTRGTTAYTYNAQNLLESLTYPDGRKLEYGYDAVGNRIRMTATIGVTILTTTYTYDAAGRLAVVTDPNGRTYSHSYDANGNRGSVSYPNGVSTTYTYDTLNHLTDLTTVGTSGTIQSYQFTLGLVGNRVRIDELDGTVREYNYDALYRLTGERITESAGLLYEKSFTYDPVGNRLSQTTSGLGAGTVDYSYDERDRLLAENSVSYTWDDNGNLTSKSSEATYFWDYENRLIRVEKVDGTIVAHTYDADGNRVRTETTMPGGSATTTNYLVDTSGYLGHVVAETDDTGTLLAYYVRGDDLLAVIRPTGTRFYHADGLGSIRYLTDEAGNITDRYTYTAFGEPLSHTGSDPNPYQFASEPYDPNIGFIYLRARYYNVNTGGFISSDAWRGDVYDPISLHKYLYGNANPVDKVDPTGHCSYASVMSGLTIGAIIAVISSFAFPMYRASIGRLAGRTDTFRLQFFSGGALSHAYLTLGGVNALIEEIGVPNPKRGYFLVFTFGFRIGFSLLTSPVSALFLSLPDEFNTGATQRIEAFEGIGNISFIEATIGSGVTWGIIALPDGTPIGPRFTGEAGVGGGGIFVNYLMAIWELIGDIEGGP
jgi:RHS repeat-associated protein